MEFKATITFEAENADDALAFVQELYYMQPNTPEIEIHDAGLEDAE